MDKCLIINAGTLCGLVSLGKAMIRDEVGHKPTDEELSKCDFLVGFENGIPSIEVVIPNNIKEV